MRDHYSVFDATPMTEKNREYIQVAIGNQNDKILTPQRSEYLRGESDLIDDEE